MPPRCPRLTNHDHRIPQVVTGNREVTAVLTVHDNGNWEVCGPDSFRIHGPMRTTHGAARRPLQFLDFFSVYLKVPHKPAFSCGIKT